MSTDFKPGQEVEWRSDGRIANGAYVQPYQGLNAWALVDTDDGDLIVRPHILRLPGELAAEDAALTDLVERARGYPIGDDEHARHCRTNRFPWCDTCKCPSVANEWQGLCHSTAEFPFGVPEHLDDSGHEVTHHEWFQVPR